MENGSFERETKILFCKYKVYTRIYVQDFNKEVYLGKSILDNKLVAIKVEKKNSIEPLLESEAFVQEIIKGPGIPKILSFGVSKSYRVLVTPLLGQNLYDIFNQKEKKFSLKEICMIALQVLERIQLIHSHYYIHRNIKPDIFFIGKEDPDVIYLTNFCLCKKYRSSKTKNHIKFTFTGKFTGTLRFCSANALRGGEQSRKDDLISIGYMLIYFMRKKLPWQLVKRKNKIERFITIYKLKRFIKPETLCNSLPKEMLEYMRYTQKLGFEQNPDYKYLKELFVSILSTLNPDPEKLISGCIKNTNLLHLNNNLNSSIKKIDFRRRILKNYEEDFPINEHNSLEKSSLAAAPLALNNSNNQKIIRNNSGNYLAAPNPLKNDINSNNNNAGMMVNIEYNIINDIMDNFENIDINEINEY